MEGLAIVISSSYLVLVFSNPLVVPCLICGPDNLGEMCQLLGLRCLTKYSLGGSVQRLTSTVTSPVMKNSPAAKYM